MSKRKLFRSVVALVTGLLLLFSTMTVGYAATTTNTNPTTIYATATDGKVLTFNFTDLFNAYVTGNTAYITVWTGVKSIDAVTVNGVNVDYAAFLADFVAGKVASFAAYAAATDAKTLPVPQTAAPVAANGTVGTAVVLVPFAIESVSALNAKQVQIVFNKAIDEDTITTDNIQLYRGSNTTDEAWAYSLSDDGTTLTLGFTSAIAAQDSKVKVVAQDIESEDGSEVIADTTQTVTMRDTESPSVLSATFDNSKTITIKVSEPLVLETGANALHVMNNVLVDGKKLVGSIAQDFAKNELTVTLGAKLATGEHKVKVTGYRDYANWLAADAEYVSSVGADTTAPSIVAVDAGRTSVKVTFDEVVNTLGTLTINGANYTTGTTTDNKTFKITLTGGKELGLAYLVTGTISYYGTTDVEGNVRGTASAPAKFTFVAKDDTTAPTATVTLDSSNNIFITFSEVMSDPGKVKVQDSDGTVLAKNLVPAVYDSDANEYKVTAANAKLNGIDSTDNYTITLSDATDNSVRVNEIADTVVTLGAADVVAPHVVSAVLTQAHSTRTNAAGTTVEDDPAQVTVYFSEPMDVSTITNVNNYTFALAGGSTTPVNLGTISGVTLEAASDAKSVVITFPGLGTNHVNAGATATSKIYVLLVKDAAGNTLTTDTSVTYAFNVGITTASPVNTLDTAAISSTYSANEVVMVAKNKIKVGFTNPMAVVDPSEFVLYKTGTSDNVKLVGVACDLNSTGKVATITLSGNLTADAMTAAADGGAAVLYIKANGNTEDIYGNTITADSKIDASATNNALSVGAVADYLAPSLVSITAGNKGTAADNKFTVKFDEPVTVATLSTLKNDVMITDADGNVLSDSDYSISDIKTTPDDEVVFTVNGDLLADGEQSLTFELIASRYLKDASGNYVEPFETSLSDFAVDGDAAVSTLAGDGADNSATQLVVTFSEALYDATGVALTNGADVKTLFVYDGTAGNYTSATYSATNKTVTFVFTAAENGKKLTLADNKLYDQVGNECAADVYTYTAANTPKWAK